MWRTHSWQRKCRWTKFAWLPPLLCVVSQIVFILVFSLLNFSSFSCILGNALLYWYSGIHIINFYNFISQIPSGNLPCHNCVHCYSVIKGTHFNHPRSSVDIKVKWWITCKTIYVVYLKMSSYYILCRQNVTSVSNHQWLGTSTVHHSLSELHYMGIETVRMPQRSVNRDRILLQREAYWIHFLDTLIPKWLNEKI